MPEDAGTSEQGANDPLLAPDTDEFPPLSPDELAESLGTFIETGIDVAEALAKTEPSRALSLALTKLEEAQMWYAKHSEGR